MKARSLPCDFDQYMAPSARCMSSAWSVACSGKPTMPALTVSAWPVLVSTSAARPRIRATTSAASCASEPGSAIMNSSPPIRPHRSYGRRSSEMARASRSSASSPAAWPSVSLTILKSSMSSATRASGVPWRRQRLISCARRSWKARWLRWPVSGSLSASIRSSARASKARARSPISSWRSQRRRARLSPPRMASATARMRSRGRTMRRPSSSAIARPSSVAPPRAMRKIAVRSARRAASRPLRS